MILIDNALPFVERSISKSAFSVKGGNTTAQEILPQPMIRCPGQ
jgi:hypothetical protein